MERSPQLESEIEQRRQEIEQMTAKDDPYDFKRRFGWITGGVIGSFAVGITMMAWPFVRPALRRVCIPYIPATPKQIDNLVRAMKASDFNPKRRVVEMGSGDGRVCRALSRAGFEDILGVEMNGPLVFYSKISNLVAGRAVYHSVKYQLADMFNPKFRINDAHAAVCFGTESSREAFLDKFGSDLRFGSIVFSCRYPLLEEGDVGWVHVDTVGEGLEAVYVYRKESSCVVDYSFD